MAHGPRAGAHPEVSPLPSARAVKISSWIPAQGRDDTEQNYRQRPRICPLHHASRGPPPPLCGGGPPTVGTGRGARSSPVHGGGGPAQPVEGAAETPTYPRPKTLRHTGPASPHWADRYERLWRGAGWAGSRPRPGGKRVRRGRFAGQAARNAGEDALGRLPGLRGRSPRAAGRSGQAWEIPLAARPAASRCGRGCSPPHAP